MRAWAWSVAVVLMTGLWPLAVVSADGRIEINQSVIDEAGGFPYTISSPGSYVLTGALLVPADTDGIVIATNEVTLDLNGFSITGPATCGFTTCPLGTGSAIRPQGLFGGANSTRVHNGIVRGFGSHCVRVLAAAHVENLTVSECGGVGISANVESIVTKNRVRLTGQTGISMSPGTMYLHNTVASAGLGGGGQPSFSGGRASGGNSCDDGGCSPRGARRYYLTPERFPADQVITACDEGYHMASLWEIFNTAALEYDVLRGYQRADSGQGPPSFPNPGLDAVGWIRTGGSVASFNNCLAWTTTDPASSGWSASLGSDWDSEFQHVRVSPWFGFQYACNLSLAVWCVED